FQFPPKPELAAAASLPLLLLTILLLRAQALALGRRGYAVLGGKYGEPRLVRLGWLRWPAAALALFILAMPLFLPYAALFNSAFSRVASRLVSIDTITLHNVRFTFLELSSTLPALENTFLLATTAATVGALLALLIAYIVARRAVPGHRILAFLATAPLLRSAVIATWCFVFVAVIRELSAAVILFTSETKVLSVLIFDLKESGDVGAIAVLSLAMVAITTIVITIANRLGGGRETGRLAARAAG